MQRLGLKNLVRTTCDRCGQDSLWPNNSCPEPMHLAAQSGRKIYKNKDSVWVCLSCNKREVWTWDDIANHRKPNSTPFCSKCHSDMNLDVEATEIH